ncbi:T9SS type A sorting domain-containing protein [Ferruginibacter sp.]|nr:T9SS type A sorting domain-containing protein [Ferruginibacter sp.]
MNVKILLSTSFIISSFAALAQDAGKTYAITGDGTGDFRWMNIRQVDIASGKVTRDIYQNNKTAFVLTDATTKTPASQLTFKYDNNGAATTVQMQDVPTVTMVAAAAYDKRHDKLFFTPMRVGELRWLDVNAKGDIPKFYTEKTQLLNTLDMMDEANHITRMDIAADGNGYAITNDGNHLIRFTTGKKTVITDMGNLVDAEDNKSGISIHNKCTSWGGDMIADAYGKLYVISAMHQVFKVDIDTRITTHIGTITGLPANYTTNGAAVDADDYIVLSSANSFEGYYKIKLDDLAAVKIEGSDKVYNASDLANGNLLFQKEATAKKTFDIPSLAPVATINTDARIFPNPVTSNEFKVLFDGQKAGKYTVALIDLSGRAVFSTIVNVSSKLQRETVRIARTVGKGVYLVKVSDASNQLVFTERVVVQ